LREIPTDTTPGDDPPPLPPPDDADIDRPGNPTRYVRKRFDADAAWMLSRSTLTLNAFWEDREDQVLVTDLDTETSSVDDETFYGVNGDFSWELGTRTVARVGASWRRREVNDFTDFEPGEPVTASEDDLYTLDAGLDYLLGLRTTLGLATGFRSREGATSDNSGDYDEFWASVHLVRTF
jgi:uncharacterized protein (PEP-CTERM system associated)